MGICKYDFVVTYAIYFENQGHWYVDKEKVSISAENIFIAKFKAIDYIMQKMKGRNPWLDEAILKNHLFTNVQLIF